MENLSSSKYAALPERLYMLQGGKVIYKVKNISTYQHSIQRFLSFKVTGDCFTFNSQYFVLFESETFHNAL